MKKREALNELDVKISSVIAWKEIVDKAVAKSDPNTILFMRVFEDQVKELHKAFNSLKYEICLGWD